MKRNKSPPFISANLPTSSELPIDNKENDSLVLKISNPIPTRPCAPVYPCDPVVP
jgi:hypothetical protein